MGWSAEMFKLYIYFLFSLMWVFKYESHHTEYYVAYVLPKEWSIYLFIRYEFSKYIYIYYDTQIPTERTYI